MDYFRHLNWRADHWALASGSVRAKDVFASLVTGTSCFYEVLKYQVLNGNFDGCDLRYLARLARIVAVGVTSPEDRVFSLRAFERSQASFKQGVAHKRIAPIAFGLAYNEGEFGLARRVLNTSTLLKHEFFNYRDVDLRNPFATGATSSFELWLSRFNEPFEHFGLSPIGIREGERVPFERVYSDVEPCCGMNSEEPNDQLDTNNPLVSVVLTTYNPDFNELRHAVQSILGQTWTNLELLLVNDASEEFPHELIDRIAVRDSRLKVITAERNGGTYRARNLGLENANGVYVTGQDTDDWSHPQRIERQVRRLHGDETISGVLTQAIRTDETLARSALGFAPIRRCEVSLMYRLKDARKIDGYLPMRKAADSEFKERLVAWSGKEVVELPDPLYLTRLSRDSLSRSDFRHGWTDDSRLAFTRSYRMWHSDIKKLSPMVSLDVSETPVVAPQKIVGRPNGIEQFDFGFVADWRVNNETMQATVEEMRTLLEHGFSICILQKDSPFVSGANVRNFVGVIQRWLNNHEITFVSTTDIAHVAVLIIRDPATMMYSDHVQYQIEVGKLYSVAEDPWSLEGDELQRYKVREVELVAQATFQQSHQWLVPGGVPSAEYTMALEIETLSGTYPSVVRGYEFDRSPKPRPLLPVQLGMEVRPVPNDIISDVSLIGETLLSASLDVWILGDGQTLHKEIGSMRTPVNWTVFPNHDLGSKNLLRHVDAILCIDRNSALAPPRRFVLEALANGVPVVVLVGSQHSGIPGVIKAELQDVETKIKDVLTNKAFCESRIQRGQNWVAQNYDVNNYVETMSRLLNESAEDA